MRLFLTALIAVGVFGAGSAPAFAAPILVSFDATLDDGNPPLVNTGIVVGPGQEISPGDGSDIGQFGLFDDEFLDVSSTALVTTFAYQLQGGGDPHAVNPAYSLSGWPADSTLLFNNFLLNVAGELVSVTAAADNAIGAAGGGLVLGTDYGFTPSSLTIYLAGLGILDPPEGANANPLGMLTFTLTFRETGTPPEPVPEPATLTMLGFGGVAWALSRCRRRRA